MVFKQEKFRKAIILKRSLSNRMGMRECSEEIGISPATLSRIERGKMPDLMTYVMVCKWLKQPINKYINV